MANAFTINEPVPAMTPRNALMMPAPTAGEVSPSQPQAPTPAPLEWGHELIAKANAYADQLQQPRDPNRGYGDVLPVSWPLNDPENGGFDLQGGIPGAFLSGTRAAGQAAKGEAFDPEDVTRGAGVISSPSMLARPTGALLAAGPRIPTRVPTDKAAKVAGDAVHTAVDNIVGLDSSKAAAQAYANNAELLRNYRGLNLPKDATDDEVVNAFIGHAKDNLLWLHDKMGEDLGTDTRDRARLWYDGANRIASDWADKHGLRPEQTAGTLAALSPQKDWFQNVSLGSRLVDVVQNRGDTKTTKPMLDWAKGYIERLGKTDPEGAAAMGDTVRAMRGRTFNQINDPESRAVWARVYDEAHNPRSYPQVTPEGDLGETMLTKGGEPQKVGWGSFKEISKALESMSAPDQATLSRLMGGKHKVRNFFNNIIDPNNPAGDVTIDTHAVAAALLRPLAGKHDEVSHGLGLGKGSSNHAGTGSMGLYGLYAEAYRQAAKAREIQPRQMQSITWEAIRGLFSAEQKRNKPFAEKANQYWDDYANGKISVDEARDAIHAHAGGINSPDWGISDAGVDD